MALRNILITGGILLLLGFHKTAFTASIETLVMPGPVSQPHAEIEENCSDCHAAFSKTLQRDLCLSCHEHQNIMRDQAAQTGFHGKFEPARNVECSTCHTEHEGRDTDIIGLDRETFDHSFTDFELLASHAELTCVDCHDGTQEFHEAPMQCFSCHEDNDFHDGQFGEDCASCHQQTSWAEVEFNHTDDTDFPLTGAHQQAACGLCHTNQRYQGIPQDCHACHQVDDEHQGEYGTDCANCHQTDDWKQSTFDHARSTDFELLGRHAQISCSDCHVGRLFDQPMDTECAACHLTDDVHQGSNGRTCDTCHNNRSWAETGFNHATDTDFTLNGAHAELACEQCHAPGSPDMSLPTQCASCHRLDDIHQQSLGEQCDTCHQETAWSDNVRFDHDLTRFPLIGLHAIATCEACHLSPVYSEVEDQCIDCHEDNDVHNKSFGEACGNCHNPNDWIFWEFDHAEHSDFSLEGQHAELMCADCHGEGSEFESNISTSCFACHRGDDVHFGEFGRRCAQCHNVNSFTNPGTFQ